MQEFHPLAEVFGFPPSNVSKSAEQFRQSRLCPFNNRVPSCTKDKAIDPLGVCSVLHDHSPVITCPLRYTEDWLITAEASAFFFAKKNATWTSLREVRLQDSAGQSAGNIDYVLVEYDSTGKVIDFGALEVQAVYISGNVRNLFETYMKNRHKASTVEHLGPASSSPRPDFLSSSRKRLIPQLLYKGAILQSWGKKQAVVLQQSLFITLPELPECKPDEADIAWLLYDLELNSSGQEYELVHKQTVFTRFAEALQRIFTPQPSNMEDFIAVLQRKLDEDLGSSPDTPLITDIPLQ